MRDFYERFYAAAEGSAAHALFSRRAFGLDLCQHGFADVEQLQAVLQVTALAPEHRVLDLGCGNGRIAEYLSDRSGAHVTGLDYIPLAIDQAQERTAGNRDRLTFVLGDINALQLPPAAFDVVVSIDSLYFSNDLQRTVGELAAALRPGGQMALFYAHGWEPWIPIEEFDPATLPADRNPLGTALGALGLPFEAQDWTAADCRLALHRRQVLEELRPQFESEDLMFIYDNRRAEAQGIARACELGLQRRTLYHIRMR